MFRLAVGGSGGGTATRRPVAGARRLAAGVALGLLLAVLAGCRADSAEVRSPGAPSSPEPARPPDPPPQVAGSAAAVSVLAPGASLERAIGGDESHRYSLALEAGQYLELVAAQRGADVVLELRDPAGRSLIRVDSPTGAHGEERLTAVSATAGEYRLEVRAWGGSDPGGGEDANRYALEIVALRPATAADRRRAEADHLFAVAEALRARGDPASARRAVDAYGEALAAAETLDDLARQAATHQRIAWTYRRYLDDKRAAVPAYQRAAELFHRLGDLDGEALAVTNLGRVWYDLGELERAFACSRQALELCRRSGDEAGEASVLNNLALLYLTQGEAQEALTFYEEALARLRRLGEAAAETRVLYNRGQFYRTLGEPRHALDDLGEALALARRRDDRPRQASALAAMGQVYTQTGELTAARAALEEALALRRQLGSERGRAAALRSLAAIDLRLGRHEAAASALAEALTLFRRLEARRDEAAVLTLQGELLLAQGEPAAAGAALEGALERLGPLRDPANEAAARMTLARAERSLGRLEAARAQAEAALEQLEALRAGPASPDLQASFFARQQEHFDFLVDLLMEMHRRQPAAGYDAAALEVSERSRSRSLLELLAEMGAAGQGADEERRATEEGRLSRRLAALELQRQELLDGAAAADRLAAVERQLRALLRQLDGLRGRRRQAQRAAAGWAAPEPLSAADIQRQVADGETLLLEYHLGAERSTLWAVTPRRLLSWQLPPGSEIEAAARRLHRLLERSHLREARGPTAGALAELSATLLGPVAAAGELSRRRLLVVAGGALQYVPFGALPVPAQRGGGDRPAAEPAAPLMLDHEVISLPSASALAVLRRAVADRSPAPKAVAVLADPVVAATDPRLADRLAPAVDGRPTDRALPPAEPVGAGPPLARLPFSQGEAVSIAALVPAGDLFIATGFAARRQAVLAPQLGRYRVVHFATHGALDSEHPELSHLLLSRFDAAGRSVAGRLYAHEIYRLELPAELVTLSACRSALGEEVPGEGLVGLTQAFFHAGAARVLVSLWQVDDEATAELMAAFYRSLLADDLLPAAALAAAQRSIRQQPRWRAPYYWAGFVLQGEWRPIAKHPPPRGEPTAQ